MDRAEAIQAVVSFILFVTVIVFSFGLSGSKLDKLDDGLSIIEAITDIIDYLKK